MRYSTRGAEGLNELGRDLRVRWMSFVSSFLLLLWLVVLVCGVLEFGFANDDHGTLE